METQVDNPMEGRLAGKPEGNLIQMRFTDEASELASLDAAEMADVLQGVVQLSSQLHKTGEYGDGLPPEIRVRPPQEGSFIIEAFVAYADWYNASPATATGVTIAASTGAWQLASNVGGAISQTIEVGTKLLRGNHPVSVDDTADGNVRVTWRSGQVDEMTRKTWHRLNAMKRPTRQAFRKIMSPLGGEAEALQVRNGLSTQSTEDILNNTPTSRADKTDYRSAAKDEDEVTTDTSTFEAEAQISSVDFRSSRKWRVDTLYGQRQATIEDEDFLRRVNRGFAIGKDDLFDVEIREDKTTKNGRTRTEWALTRVTLKRRGGSNGGSLSSSSGPSTGGGA